MSILPARTSTTARRRWYNILMPATAQVEPGGSDRRTPLGARFPLLLDFVAVGLPLGVLYALTRSHDLGIIDSGELATVCARLGIAHPTGYPLYTLLGRVAILLWPGPPIDSLDLLSAAAAWLAALLTVRASRLLLVSVWGLESRWIRWGAPWAVGLWFGTDRELWQQATGNEVYSLHLAGVAGLLLLLVAIGVRKADGRTVLVLGYLTGVSFAHHLSAAFLLPAIVAGGFLWLADVRGFSRRIGWVAALGGLALLAWSVNLYLPIRSAQDPVLDWGDPVTWARFWRHYLAAQYRVWQFESSAEFTTNLSGYLASLPSRVSWAVLVLSIPGTWALRRRGRILSLLGLVLLTTLIWASGYSIHDLAPYFLPVDLVLVLLAGAGVAAVTAWASRRRSRLLGGILAGLLILTGGAHAARQWSSVDRANDHFIRTHATMVLESLPPRAILLSAFWDAIVSPALYLQEVEGMRPDVTIVDPELLRRSWYFPQLRRADSELLGPVEPTIQAFLADLALFEEDRPYDPAQIERNYRTVIQGIALAHRATRPTFYSPDVDPSCAGSLPVVPWSFVFAIAGEPQPEIPPPDLEALLSRGFRADDPIHLLVIAQWRRMAENRVLLLERAGRVDRASPWRALIQAIDTRVPGARTAGPDR
ncbi:MAG: DUF2723 domain-containing protein [Candidatus Eisenbacteria bacterium]|uniref:DUF2723 domain-containing protein n=1 Tax=Eiseniibacteriota bacterium TaxID=2212470 RepID=A0A956LWR6_UNCEI|nr:DUF2723 domain-containing protein [Candidatus Eisenbacteria bacterium]